MEIGEDKIKPSSKPLTDFDGETTITVGTIKLAVHTGGITKLVEFVVIDKPAVYDMVMGTPWIYSLRAVPSTYH